MNNKKQYSKSYLDKLKYHIDAVNYDQIDRAVELVKNAWDNNQQIITLGNGGSSLTALHFVNDWNKSLFLSRKKQFRGRTLVDNIGLVMSYGNDFSFQDIFVEQLKNIMQPKDLIIAISGSGNSENVIRAVQWANDNDGITLGLCGYDGGRLINLAQEILWVNAFDMQICEDIHSIFGHIVMQGLCEHLK